MRKSGEYKKTDVGPRLAKDFHMNSQDLSHTIVLNRCIETDLGYDAVEIEFRS